MPTQRTTVRAEPAARVLLAREPDAPASQAPREDALSSRSAALFPKSEAVRALDLGWFARHSTKIGFSSNLPPAVLGAMRGATPFLGAPLPKLVAVPELEPELSGKIEALAHALANRHPQVIRNFVQSASPLDLAKADRALGWGHVSGALSLRDVLHEGLEGSELSRSVRLMERKGAELRRASGTPIHDLAWDPSGLFGPAVDGRLAYTIDKVLEARRLLRVTRVDLVNEHEVTGNNKIEILSGGRRAMAALHNAIGSAEHFIHVSFFIMKSGRRGRAFTDALIEAARRGVKVRVAFDEFGQRLARSDLVLMAHLGANGVEVVCNHILDVTRSVGTYNPADHRKAVIIDGRVAFTGGMNIGDDYVDEWHDLFVKVEGDAVHQIHAEWMLNWLQLRGRIDPDLDDEQVRARYFPPTGEPGRTRVKLAQSIPGQSREILDGILQLIDGAAVRILIENPYVTETAVHDALIRAARRGVQVKIVIPRDNNHPACAFAARTRFQEFLDAGIEIYEYPGMSHGKAMAVDGRFSVIGTANLDALSALRVYEMNLNIHDPAVTRALERDVFFADIAKSRRLRPEDITALDVAWGHFWRLFSSHL